MEMPGIGCNTQPAQGCTSRDPPVYFTWSSPAIRLMMTYEGGWEGEVRAGSSKLTIELYKVLFTCILSSVHQERPQYFAE